MTGKAIPADARRADSPIKRPEVGNRISLLCLSDAVQA